MSRKITARLAAIIAAIGLLFLGATAAFAQSCTGGCPSSPYSPVTATATVGSYITLSGISPSITFTGATSPLTATDAESYTVVTNDLSGYNVLLNAATNFAGESLHFVISDSNVTIHEVGATDNGASITLGSGAGSGSNAFYTLYTAVPGDFGPDSFTETWNLTVPGDAPPDTYTADFQYVAMGN